jgi:thioredoxin-like negative regulator of GroEL
MSETKKLAIAEKLIEQGELKKAKEILTEILEKSGEDENIDVLIKNANTIIALEIIDQIIKSDPKEAERFKKQLVAQKESDPCQTSCKLEEMIAKGLL